MHKGHKSFRNYTLEGIHIPQSEANYSTGWNGIETVKSEIFNKKHMIEIYELLKLSKYNESTTSSTRKVSLTLRVKGMEKSSVVTTEQSELFFDSKTDNILGNDVRWHADALVEPFFRKFKSDVSLKDIVRELL
jgi:hypothetical protein